MKILIIDDHRLVNSALTSLLKEKGRVYECIQANTLGQARAVIKGSGKKLPDIIILDLILGKEDGFDFLPYLNDYCAAKKITKPPVLVCSMREESYCVQTALKLNARGYICKSADETQFLEAIDTVLSGEVYISDDYKEKAAKLYAIYDKFSKRENEIFNLIKKNKTNHQIAKELTLSIRTVESHMSNIYFKTGAKTRQELIAM